MVSRHVRPIYVKICAAQDFERNRAISRNAENTVKWAPILGVNRLKSGGQILRIVVLCVRAKFRAGCSGSVQDRHAVRSI